MAKTKSATPASKTAANKASITANNSKSKVNQVKAANKKQEANQNKSQVRSLDKKEKAEKANEINEELESSEQEEVIDSSDEEEEEEEIKFDKVDSSEEEESDEEVTKLVEELDSDVEKSIEKEALEPSKEKKAIDGLSKQMKPELKKRLDAINQREQVESERGVIYLGRIPNAFTEPSLRRYFKQFGTITNLRLSRNPKSGHSRHYAFIEFHFKEVAEIVAETMDNYLLAGRLLKCKLIPPSKVHPNLFFNSSKKNKKMKLNRIVRKERKLRIAPKTNEQIMKRSLRLIMKEKAKNDKLKKLGINYESNEIQNQLKPTLKKSDQKKVHKKKDEKKQDNAPSEVNKEPTPAKKEVPKPAKLTAGNKRKSKPINDNSAMKAPIVKNKKTKGKGKAKL